ncbi:hypothetical protein [Rhizobium straminoryzae]|uniref:Uncharacterized protein n=1 Tax=Rhizobium straminoryzae TaxID=1387186 RepID=A0A549TCZ5_9HYPH|nr:hypothetical protein [Rhizobium straminoryzae]TRL39821.1 hypothetical protein FNA46_07750 [Rhizobium straminoryzae]
MSAVFARILLRYAAGALVARGLLDIDTAAGISTDQDLAAVAQIAIGAGMGAATEIYYALARRFGWSR